MVVGKTADCCSMRAFVLVRVCSYLCVSYVTFRNMCCDCFSSPLCLSCFFFPSLLFLHPIACPEASQLVSCSSSLRCTPREGEPLWSSLGTIPEISLNLHLRFHLPLRDGGRGTRATSWEWGGADGWGVKTAVGRISDFPCRTNRYGEGGTEGWLGGRAGCCLGDHRCAGDVFPLGNIFQDFSMTHLHYALELCHFLQL